MAAPARTHARRALAPRMARAQRVEDILRAARMVFCEKGYQPCTVAEIAERIGVVEGTVYKYFASKQALLVAVLGTWYDQLFGDHRRQLAHLSCARAQLHGLLQRHWAALASDPALCRLMFHEVRGQPGYYGSPLHARNRQYSNLVLEVLTAGAASGEFRSDLPARLLRDLLFGGLEHHAWAWLCGHGPLPSAEVAAQVTQLLCDGISASGTPHKSPPRSQPKLTSLTAAAAAPAASTAQPARSSHSF